MFVSGPAPEQSQYLSPVAPIETLLNSVLESSASNSRLSSYLYMLYTCRNLSKSSGTNWKIMGLASACLQWIICYKKICLKEFENKSLWKNLKENLWNKSIWKNLKEISLKKISSKEFKRNVFGRNIFEKKSLQRNLRFVKKSSLRNKISLKRNLFEKKYLEKKSLQRNLCFVKKSLWKEISLKRNLFEKKSLWKKSL